MLKINSFLETKNAGMCGPASLKMVLEYFGTNVTEAELAGLCGTDAVSGTSDLGIKKAADAFICCFYELLKYYSFINGFLTTPLFVFTSRK